MLSLANRAKRFTKCWKDTYEKYILHQFIATANCANTNNNNYNIQLDKYGNGILVMRIFNGSFYAECTFIFVTGLVLIALST